VGAAAGAVINILTSRWNWLLFIVLTLLVGVSAVAAVVLDGSNRSTARRYGRLKGWTWPRRKRSPQINTLPYRYVTADFTGRNAEVSRLLAMIGSASRHEGSRFTAYSIEGRGGIGKTSLAVQVARQVAWRYPDAALYTELHGHANGQPSATPSDVLMDLLSQLGIPGESIPDSFEGRASLWRRELSDARVLVILDNASGADQVRELLAGGDRCLFIITSRQRLTDISGVFSVPLEPLPPEDAAVLFGRVLGDSASGQEADIAEAVQRLGCLPLAIQIAASRLAAHPARTVNVFLKNDIIQSADLERVYALSYQDLTQQQKDFFRLLAVHPGGEITAESAAVLTGTPPRAAARMLEELYNWYLLTEPLPHRFKFHDLIKDFARRESDSAADEPGRHDALLRLLAYYTFMAAAASYRIGMNDRFPVPPPPGSTEILPAEDEGSALNWFDSEQANLLACAHYANANALLPYAWQLPACMTPYLRLRGLLREATSLLDTALLNLALEPDRAGEAITRRRLGQLARLEGDYPLSRRHLDRSLELSHQIGDQQGIAWCHHELGHLDRVDGNLAGARQHLTEALAMNRSLGRLAAVAANEITLGTVLRSGGETELAREYLDDGLRISAENGDHRQLAYALYQLGALECDQGNYSEARNYLNRALSLYDEARNRHGQAECYLNLGISDRLAGDYDNASQYLQQALAIYIELRYRRSEAETYAELADAAEAAGRHDISTAHRMRADAIYAELKQSLS
jgi:tetratricopeptide (TPR) repeat protein